jgi:hypothetical protein
MQKNKFKMEASPNHHIWDDACRPNYHLPDPTLFLFPYRFHHNVYNVHAFLNSNPDEKEVLFRLYAISYPQLAYFQVSYPKDNVSTLKMLVHKNLEYTGAAQAVTEINFHVCHLIAINISVYNSIEHLQPIRIISFSPASTSSFVSSSIFLILRSR